MLDVFDTRFQAPYEYGHAYGRPLARGYSSSSSSSSYYDDNNQAAYSAVSATSDVDDTKLKSLLREIRVSVAEAKGFWTRLPYDLCETDSVGTGEAITRRDDGRGGGYRGTTAAATKDNGEPEYFFYYYFAYR